MRAVFCRCWTGWLALGVVIISGCAAPTALKSAATITSMAVPTALTTTALRASVTPPAAPIVNQRAYSLTVQIKDNRGVPLNVTLSYLLYLPAEYGQDSQQNWPVILYLHGAGQRGDQIDQVARLGLPNLLTTRLSVPALVVSPQLPAGANWTDYTGVLEKLVDQIMAQYAVDPKRVYVTGFSMGGYGTWALGLAAPNRFAALVPVAGGWDAQAANLCTLKSMPVWVLHGARDEIVAPAASEEMVKALQACGGNVRFTLLPRTTHEAAATVAYLQPGLFDWLLAQHLP